MNNQLKWGADLYKFVGKAFEVNSKKWKEKRPIMSLLGEETTKSAHYDLYSGNDFPVLPRYDGSLNKVNPQRAFRAVITPVEYLGSYDVHYKAYKNDMSGEVNRSGKLLADSASMSVITSVMDLFGSAFSANVLGADGKPWAAKDHPVASKESDTSSRAYIADPDAGTYSNLIASALSVAGIDEAIKLGNRYVTPAGKPYLADYDLLLVSPELEGTVKKLFGSEAKYMPTKNPDDDTNAANPYHGMRYMVMGGGTHGFGAKQWAICDSTQLKEVAKIIYNTKPEVREGINPNPYIKTYIAYCDYALGHADARPIIFSNPS